MNDCIDICELSENAQSKARSCPDDHWPMAIKSGRGYKILHIPSELIDLSERQNPEGRWVIFEQDEMEDENIPIWGHELFKHDDHISREEMVAFFREEQ